MGARFPRVENQSAHQSAAGEIGVHVASEAHIKFDVFRIELNDMAQLRVACACVINGNAQSALPELRQSFGDEIIVVDYSVFGDFQDYAV